MLGKKKPGEQKAPETPEVQSPEQAAPENQAQQKSNTPITPAPEKTDERHHYPKAPNSAI